MSASRQGVRFHAFLRQGSYAPVIKEEFTGKEWIDFGHDNLFPQRLIELANNCGPLNTAKDTFALMVAGAGLRFVNDEGETVDRAQDLWYSWTDAYGGEDKFLHCVASDFCLTGAAAFDVIRKPGEVAGLSHVDVTGVRIGKDKGRAYYSPDWREVMRRGRTAERYKPEPLDLYDGTAKAKSLVYVKGYKQGLKFYGEPWYLPAIPHAEVWSKVAPFNRVQIDTGFMANVHLHTWLKGDEDDLDAYDRDIEDAYTGSSSRGIFHTYGAEGDAAPILTPIPFTNHAGELDEIMQRAETSIYRVYGLPPVLAGIDVQGGLAGQGDALKEAFNFTMRTKVAPRQRIIAGVFERLMRDAGVSDFHHAEFEPLDLFDEEMDDATMREAYLASVTINEHREGALDMEPIEGGDRLLKMPPQGQLGQPQNTEDE